MRPNQPVPIIGLVAAAALSGNPLQAETDPIQLTRGAMLRNSCAACHGTAGNSPGAIPGIGGKSAGFLAGALATSAAANAPAR
jgi:cytochrome c553